jgi:hypothetical protein
MKKYEENYRGYYGNLLLVSGNGRNVGKTFFACRIISLLAQKQQVTAVKISPHLHEIPENIDVLCRTENFTVINETEINRKDSSLFLQSGAVKVLFVMCKPENLHEAFQHIKPYLTSGPVVCESAGLGETIATGLSFFMKKPNDAIIKNLKQAQRSQIIENDGQNIHFDFARIEFENNLFYLKY